MSYTSNEMGEKPGSQREKDRAVEWCSRILAAIIITCVAWAFYKFIKST